MEKKRCQYGLVISKQQIVTRVKQCVGKRLIGKTSETFEENR